jgi:amino acid permease
MTEKTITVPDTPVQNSTPEEGALKVRKLTFWEAAFIIIGANIGSGILGLAYASRKAGWPILLLWLIIAGFFNAASLLYVAETAMRTRKPLQLPGLAERYVGKLGAWLIFLGVTANAVGCMIAYTTGSGRILSEILRVPVPIGSLIFTIPAVVVVWFGLKATGVATKLISLGMLTLVCVIILATFLSSKASAANVLYADWKYAIPVFNVAVFCMITQYAIPELVRGLSHQPKKIPLAIITGRCIVLVFLILVPLAVLSLTGKENVSQVATIAWGKMLGRWAFFTANAFALCAMMTSYWTIGGSFLTNIVDKFKFKSETDIPSRLIAIFIVAVPPFVLAFSGLVDFVGAINFAGTFGGIIMSVLSIMMLNNSRKTGDIEPEWKNGFMAAKPIQVLMVVILGAAGIYALCNMLKLLPSGW